MTRPETPVEHQPLNVAGQSFHPVIQLPSDYDVYDFSEGYDPDRNRKHTYGIGRYNERRPGMYVGVQYDSDQRDIHVGIDIAAPVGEPVYAFFRGHIFRMGINPLPWDYGPTIITAHEWLGQSIYALHGHLSSESLDRWSLGDEFGSWGPLGIRGYQNRKRRLESPSSFSIELKSRRTLTTCRA